MKNLIADKTGNNNLYFGALPLSDDILVKANIGLWAFELDEGEPPRMYVNEPMLGLIGLDHQISPEETYHAWYDHIDINAYDVVGDAVEKMTAGQHAEVQYPWHYADGRTIIVRCGGVRNYDYKKGVRIEGTHQDVTQVLHLVEKTLKMDREIIEILASEYSSVYFIDLTTDHLTPYTMNVDTERSFGSVFRSGITYSEAFSLYVEGRVFPDDQKMMLKRGAIKSITEELCTKKTYLTIFRNTEGEFCEMKFVKVGNEEGTPHAVALGFSNKDEEIREKNALKDKQDRDRAVIAGLSDDFSCVVYTNYKDFSEIMYRSDPVFEEKIEGWFEISNFKERLDAMAKNITEPDERKAFWNATRPKVVRKAIKRDGVYYINFKINLGGQETYYQAKFARDEMHPEDNVIAGFHNVDEETRRELEALEEAKAANKAKTDFLFNMSHDIRTPMNAIIGFTNMAMKNVSDSKTVVDCLNKTQIAGELLLALINNILDMSRIESGNIVLDEKEINVHSCFKSIEPTMQELAKQKNISLSFSIENIQDPWVVCDISRCIRVFVNIITNAVKYTQDGGTVKVTATQTGKKKGCGIYQFTFEDNGIGMSEEFLARAFDEFARENSTTVSGIQGTGLGLSVCKSFVTALNGTIDCKSKQGKGTTFTVTLPFKITEKKVSEQSKKDQDKGNKALDLKEKRVLLVEDNALNQEIAVFILSEEGVVVETADDGTDAVALMKEKGPHYYDFILMDIQMPIMDGYEATKQIRAMYPDVPIPIIAVSANAFAEDKAASLSVGMNAHVAKPFNINELKTVMTSCLSGDNSVKMEEDQEGGLDIMMDIDAFPEV